MAAAAAAAGRPEGRDAVRGGRGHVVEPVGLLGVVVEAVGLLDAVAEVAAEPVAGLGNMGRLD